MLKIYELVTWTLARSWLDIVHFFCSYQCFCTKNCYVKD